MEGENKIVLLIGVYVFFCASVGQPAGLKWILLKMMSGNCYLRANIFGNLLLSGLLQHVVFCTAAQYETRMFRVIL